jgi:hypothetical protein
MLLEYDNRNILNGEKLGLFLVIGTLDPRGSKCHPNQGFYIRLLNAKFDYNISFLTSVIFWKQFFYF